MGTDSEGQQDNNCRMLSSRWDLYKKAVQQTGKELLCEGRENRAD